MLFRDRQRNIDRQHEDAIKSGLPHRPHMDEYRGWTIDDITLIGEAAGGDRIYRVQVSAWDEFEGKWQLICEVQTGQVVRWIPKTGQGYKL